jgi:penicillin-binding protein 1A
MANRRNRRIEPSFDEPARDASVAGFSLREEDRVVPSGRKPRSRKMESSRRSPKARSARGGRRKRRGLFGILMRMVYWCFVLAIWGGIAAAGMVVYYGAKMPAATTWSIPDRAPNIKLVSVDGRLIANRGMSGGEAVRLSEMSAYIPKAVIAIEDRRF